MSQPRHKLLRASLLSILSIVFCLLAATLPANLAAQTSSDNEDDDFAWWDDEDMDEWHDDESHEDQESHETHINHESDRTPEPLPQSTYQARSYEPPFTVVLIGGQPWGTHIDRGRHMAFSLTTANPPHFGTTFLTGFSVSERGSILPEIIGHLGTAANAQAEANRTRSTVYYEVPYDEDGTFGLHLEYLTAPRTALDETPYWFVARLDNLTYLGSDKNDLDLHSLPITLKWGLFFRLMSTAREHADQIAYSGMTFGAFLDFAFPITRWGQLNAAVHAGIGDPTVEASLSATAHLGNRFFLTAGSNVMEMKFGSFFRAGVRL